MVPHPGLASKLMLDCCSAEYGMRCRAGICTGTFHVLNVVPLLDWASAAKWLPRIDSHDDDLVQSQAGCCYLTGQLENDPATGAAPVSSRLQGECMSCSAKPASISTMQCF